MIDDAIDAGVAETDQLDWKDALPPQKALAQSDLVKDIAAMANSGGGVIVFGVTEEQSKATGRIDVGDVTENYERTLRSVAVSGIHPPVFGLDVVRVGDDGNRALAVMIPASAEVPHLISREKYFGAPIRNHADTEWMRERQLEALYRYRLNERRNSDESAANSVPPSWTRRPCATSSRSCGSAVRVCIVPTDSTEATTSRGMPVSVSNVPPTRSRALGRPVAITRTASNAAVRDPCSRPHTAVCPLLVDLSVGGDSMTRRGTRASPSRRSAST
jgi:hypothetical protein